MTSIIEQIREAEAQLPALNETARRTHAEAMEDGEISPDEQRKIDTIDDKISNLRDMVQRLRDEWQRNKDNYTQMRDAMSGPLAAASVCEYEILSADQEAIIAADTATNASAGAEDFADALVKGGELEQLLADFQTRLELIEEQRAEYEPALAALQPRLDQYSQSTPELAYADALMSDLVTTQGEMEAAATSGDYENALRLLSDLTAKLDEIDAAIEAKKAEYTEQRSAFDSRLSEVSAEVYVDIGAERDALAESASAMDTAAAAEDWQTALDLANQGLVDCESYHALVTEQQGVQATIQERLTVIKSDLAAHSDSTSSVKRGADANVSTIEGALSGGGSLNAALALTDTVMQQITELNALKAVNDRLAAADPDDLDDVSRAIVDEMKAAGTLNDLPTETRTTLVDNLMRNDPPTDDEHAAIQEIFSLPHVDRQFEAVDSEVRQSIVDSYMSDPEVQELAANWNDMEPADRMAAVNKLIQVPCGEDGWNVGVPANINAFDTPFVDGSGLYGAYSHGSDTMTFNVNDDAHGDFGEVLDTITHEMGHRYQMQLIERLDPTHPNALSAGDPEYEQARWLQQDDNYLNRFSDPDDDDDPFDRIYFTSPSETHSRVMGSEVKAGLREGFNLPEGEDDEEGGHHHDHAH
jgi:hypothetical protein